MSGPRRSRPPRSRGCNQCLQRHVKCDGRLECCQQCARFGLPCSGPILGPIFLDMTEKASRPSRRPRSARSPKGEGSSRSTAQAGSTGLSEPACTASPESSTVSGCSPNHSSNSTCESEAAEHMLDDSNPAPLRRGGNDFELPGFPPSALLETGPDNEYYFVSRFVDLITSSRHGYNPLRPRSWVFDLPNLLSTTDVPSVKYSIRAAALMYVAVAHRDRRAEADAVRWYLTSLESYRATLGRREDGATVAQPMPDGKTICVPMMFLYFESMRGASESWALHHRAVAEMLEARGPFNCSAGMEHGMMRSVRAMEAFDSILQNRPSRFATPEWCLIPFRQSRKISFDRLIDVLLSFPSQLQLPRADKTGSSLRNDIRGVHDLATDQKNAIEDRVNILLLQLQWWWWDFEEEHTGASPASVCPEADSPEHESPLSRAASCMFVHRDTLTANASALYSAASIILHSVLLVLALSKPPALIGADVVSLVNISQSSIASHASSVLRAAAYLTETSPFCGDTLRTIVAVQIVSLLALEDSKREQAQSMLAKWNYPRGTCPVS